MATALDVITLDQAKDWLVVDFSDADEIITRNIQTAVAWVEKYTNYYLYQRAVTIPVTSCKTAISLYPIADIVMKNRNGDIVTPVIYQSALKTYVVYGASTGLWVTNVGQNVVTLNAGFTNPSDIPPPLIDACYKLITYLYENRDAYSSTLPVDIQLLVNQFRRSPTL